MPTQFTNVTATEMDSLLSPLGFKEVFFPGTKETVYQRDIKHNGLSLMLRVYTGIVGNDSRQAGQDAIRVMLLYRSENRDVVIGQATRVHRTKNWAGALLNRLEEFHLLLPKCACPRCGAPMVKRNSQRGVFFGCSNYPQCNGIVSADLNGEPVPPKAKATPKESVSVKLPNIIAMFDHAKKHLKHPKMVFSAAGNPVRLMLASDKSKYPGSVNINDDGGFNSSVYYGRIDKDTGEFFARPNVPQAVLDFLVELNANPAKVAGEQGRLMGACCFCSLKLTDERSLAVGYGRQCSLNYDLPWGTARANISTVVDSLEDQAHEITAN